MQKIFINIQMWLFDIVSFVFSNLPECCGYFLARSVALLGYYLHGKRRKITLKNIGYAFPELSDKEKERIAKKSYIAMIYNFVEMFWTERLFKSGRISIADTSLLDGIRERNSGAVIVTLHMGDWETATAIGGFGYRFYAVARRQNNPAFNKLINRNRKLFGFDFIYKGEGARKYLTCLKKEKAFLVLLSDQHDTDVAINFFGQHTMAPDGAARLAVKFKVPIVLAYTLRDKNNNHAIFFEKQLPVIEGNNEHETILMTTQNIFYEFERVIRANPEQYFWMHNRFK